MRDVKELIGTEIVEGGRTLRITGVEIEGENIVLTTETVETVEKKKFVLSQRSLNRLEGVHPALQTLIKLGITDSPHDFMVVQGLRTAAYQNELYQQGRTKPGPKVTNCDGYKSKSNHQAKSDGYGHAIDFAIYDPALPDKIDWNNEKKYREVADHLKKIAKENGINIVWGGDWVKFKDYPHIELV
jgi:endolysin